MGDLAAVQDAVLGAVEHHRPGDVVGGLHGSDAVGVAVPFVVRQAQILEADVGDRVDVVAREAQQFRQPRDHDGGVLRSLARHGQVVQNT